MRPSIENRVIHLGEQEVSYLLKRSRRRSVGLRVDPNGLTVNAPLSASQKWLDQVLREKAGWVIGKLAEMRASLPPQVHWRDGAALPFLGGELRLTLLREGVCKPFLCGEELVVGGARQLDEARLCQCVIQWYRSQAMNCFRERVALYASRLGVPQPVMKLSNATTRWGSCNVRGEIRLSWRLIKASLQEIDYVVAHELAHLRHLDHSPAFWTVVATLYPEYRSARTALRDSGMRYYAF